MDKITRSYTAANSLPTKLIRNDFILKNILERKRIIPYHVQFIPTNACNLDCPFCSCSKEDRSLFIDEDLLYKLVLKMKQCGTEAVTITGGGEPLLYPWFNEMIRAFETVGIKMGMVSNGLLLYQMDGAILNKLTWCRISHGDHRPFTDAYEKKLAKVVKHTPKVDWAFSHVVGKHPNEEAISKIIEFSNRHDFTHVRLVTDILDKEVDIECIKKKIKRSGIDDSKVIYQGRSNYERGMDCYIGFLKPIIHADGKVYLCCGVQYSIDGEHKAMNPKLSLGEAIELEKIIDRSSKPFDGRICDVCYYGDYNRVLKGMMEEPEHGDFL
jgi:organic radical activating enzyme